MAEALKTAPAPLAVLQLGMKNEIGEGGGRAVAEALKTTPAPLAVLDLRDNGLGKEACRSIAEALSARRYESAAFFKCLLLQFTPYFQRKLGTHSEHPAMLRVAEFLGPMYVAPRLTR